MNIVAAALETAALGLCFMAVGALLAAALRIAACVAVGVVSAAIDAIRYDPAIDP